MYKLFVSLIVFTLISCEVSKTGLVIPEEIYLEEGCYVWGGTHKQVNSGQFSELRLEVIESGREWVIHETLQSSNFDMCLGNSKHYNLYSWNRDSVLTLKNYKKREICSIEQEWRYMSGQTGVKLRVIDTRNLEFCYYESSSSCEFRSDWIDLAYQRVCF
jgi:hypothetical protein